MKNLAFDKQSLQRLNLSEIRPKAEKAAMVFRQLGLQPGQVVHIMLANSTEYFFPVFGAMLCRAVASLASTALPAKSISHQLEDTETKLVVCQESAKERILEALDILGKRDEIKVLVMDFGFEDKEDRKNNLYSFQSLMNDIQDSGDFEFPTNFDPMSTCIIMWSSGTTGRAKGIPLPAKSLTNFLNLEFLEEGDCLLGSNFFHGSGFFVCLMNLVRKDLTVFFPAEDLDIDGPLKVFKATDRFKCSQLICKTSLVIAMGNFDKSNVPDNLDLSALQFVFPGGSHVPDFFFDKLKMKLPGLKAIGNVYGLTETGAVATKSYTPKWLGHVCAGIEIKLVDPLTLKLCGPGEVGEILIKSAYATTGYIKRPEANQRLFAEDGFLRTGDLGHYDDEKEARLYFDGRLKEFVVSKGYRIYCKDVESHLATHKDVIEVGAFGKPHPQHMETVVVLVLKKEELEVKELKNLLEFKDGRFKDLEIELVFIDEPLPKNEQGKLTRGLFAEVYQQSKEKIVLF